jgi:ribulose-phosphate 3-epimerase
MFLVAPSILSADFANLEREINAIAAAGADWVHVDVMDGHFAPNITIGVPVVQSLKRISKLPLDCHLMIENPEKYIEDFVAAGAANLTIHVESTPQPLQLLRRIRELGCKAGLTLRPGTPVAQILPFLTEVDLVLIMTVEPGFSGQKFRPEQVEKISEVRRELQRLGSAALIEVDGGINETTAQLCKEADVLVAGNYVFKSSDYAAAIAQLKMEYK